jgi:hypothetical protein
MARALAPAPSAPRKAAPLASAVGGEPHRGLFERFDAWLWDQERRSREAYLAKSTDVYDLEARIRDLERGVICRYY